MPAAPGESLLTTLFADVHYYFADPSIKPQHHRFDRGSYVYIYHNGNTHQAKLEIANHPATPEQDAFSGSLDNASIQYSCKQPTLVTLNLDAYGQHPGQWHLPAYDLKGEQKYMYKLNSLDIYLWTEKDAATFLAHLKAVMPASRREIRDAASSHAESPVHTPAEHRDSMSPVVQQLEMTAIGAQFPPRAESAVSAHSIPGPPTPATSAGASATCVSPPQAAPKAYNPAAPAAPEPIAHREKTPPLPDDGTGTGLANAAKYESLPEQFATVQPGYQQNSTQVTPQQAYFGGPLQQQQQPSTPGFVPGPPSQATPPAAQAHMQRTFSGALPPPPPGGPSPQPQPQQQGYALSFAPPPLDQHSSQQSTSSPPHQQSFSRQSSYGGPPGQTQYANYGQPQQQYANYPQQTFGPSVGSPGMPPGTPGYQSMLPPTPSAPPAYAGHTPLQSPALPPPPPSSQPPSQQPYTGVPTGPGLGGMPQVHGYSQYNYSAAQAAPSHGQQGAYTGDVHSQVYRPTETEAVRGARPVAERQQSGKMEQRVTSVEKKVGGFLKRLDRFM